MKIQNTITENYSTKLKIVSKYVKSMYEERKESENVESENVSRVNRLTAAGHGMTISLNRPHGARLISDVHADRFWIAVV